MTHAADDLSGVFLGAGDVPGGRLVERAATILVVMLVVLVAGATVVLATIRMNRTVSASGALEPLRVWTARPREDGVISSVAVRTGSRVEQGQLLFTIDSLQLAYDAKDLENQLAEARLDGRRESALQPIEIQTRREQRDAAVLGVANARTRLLTALVNQGLGRNVDSVLRTPSREPHVTIDLARTEVLQAESALRIAELEFRRAQTDSMATAKNAIAVRQVRAKLTLTRRRLEALEVRAPASGIVLTDRVDLLPGRAVREGEPVLELGSLTGWQAQLLVSESDVRRVAVGQEVHLSLNAADRTHPLDVSGKVVSVGAEPWKSDALGSTQILSSSSSPQYLIVVAVDRSPGDTATLLRRGFTVQARIRTGRERIGRILFDHLFERNDGNST